MSLGFAFTLSQFFLLSGVEGPRTGSHQKPQHCCENNCHDIHYYDENTKEKKDTISWPTVKQEKRNKLSQNNGQTPLTSCILFRQRTNYYCACHPRHWGYRGTSTSQPLCRRRHSTTIRRHHSTPSPLPVHHRPPSKPRVPLSTPSPQRVHFCVHPRLQQSKLSHLPSPEVHSCQLFLSLQRVSFVIFFSRNHF